MLCQQCGAVNKLAVRRCVGCGADMRASPAAAGSASRAIASAATPAATAGATGALAPKTMLQGRYRVQRELGRGSFGQVYLAQDTQAADGRQVAIKALRADGCRNEAELQEAMTWFRREVSQLLTLEHPRLPAVHSYWTAPNDASTMYLAMDYIPGDTLDEVLRKHRGPLPWRRVASWGLVLCDVLTYLHSRTPPIVFRDLKPQNVILDSRADAPALIDFGIARPHNAGGGTAIGTWGYAPLEQILGKAEPRSDIYALGATLHALLTGRDPEAEFARLQRAGHDLQTAIGQLFPPAGSLVASVPPELTAALTRATATAPDGRFRDAAAFARALRLALGETMPATVTAPAQSAPRSLLQPAAGATGQAPAAAVGAPLSTAAAPTVQLHPAATPPVGATVAAGTPAAGDVASPAMTRGHHLTGEEIAAGAAALGLLASVLPWYTVTSTYLSYTGNTSENGWHQWGVLAILCFLLGGASAISATTAKVVASLAPSLPPGRAVARVVITCGLLSVLAAVLYLSATGGDTSGPGLRSGSSWGLWLAVAAGIAMMVGGVRLGREQAQP